MSGKALKIPNTPSNQSNQNNQRTLKSLKQLSLILNNKDINLYTKYEDNSNHLWWRQFGARREYA